MAFIIIVILC